MIACVAKDLLSGATLSSGADVRFPAYSTIKVLLAAEFWRMVGNGELDESERIDFEPSSAVGGCGVLRGFRHPAAISLADLMHLALVVSDNDATNVIAGRVGLERVNALADELGLTQTRMRRLMMDATAASEGRDNVTSAADLAALLEELAAGDRLEPGVGEKVLESLELQEHLDGIARYLPPGAVYAGKCGDDYPVGRHAHDCALIREPGREAIVVVLTDGAGGFEAVARTGAALYGALGTS